MCDNLGLAQPDLPGTYYAQISTQTSLDPPTREACWLLKSSCYLGG